MLRSQLSEMTQLPPWIEALATRHGIPSDIQFGIELCLEEVVSNVIRHGYAGAEDRSVAVSFATPRHSYFEFVVEDEAPQFNPLEAPDLKAIDPGDESSHWRPGHTLVAGICQHRRIRTDAGWK